MVRNLYMRKVRPPRPTRSWAKSTGRPEVTSTTSAVIRPTTRTTGAVTRTTARSRARLAREVAGRAGGTTAGGAAATGGTGTAGDGRSPSPSPGCRTSIPLLRAPARTLTRLVAT